MKPLPTHPAMALFRLRNNVVLILASLFGVLMCCVPVYAFSGLTFPESLSLVVLAGWALELTPCMGAFLAPFLPKWQDTLNEDRAVLGAELPWYGASWMDMDNVFNGLRLSTLAYLYFWAISFELDRWSVGSPDLWAFSIAWLSMGLLATSSLERSRIRGRSLRRLRQYLKLALNFDAPVTSTTQASLKDAWRGLAYEDQIALRVVNEIIVEFRASRVQAPEQAAVTEQASAPN